MNSPGIVHVIVLCQYRLLCYNFWLCRYGLVCALITCVLCDVMRIVCYSTHNVTGQHMCEHIEI